MENLNWAYAQDADPGTFYIYGFNDTEIKYALVYSDNWSYYKKEFADMISYELSSFIWLSKYGYDLYDFYMDEDSDCDKNQLLEYLFNIDWFSDNSHLALNYHNPHMARSKDIWNFLENNKPDPNLPYVKNKYMNQLFAKRINALATIPVKSIEPIAEAEN